MWRLFSVLRDWRLSALALESLESQVAYLRPRNPRAAKAVVAEIERTCTLIAAFPGIGRLDRSSGLRVHVTRQYRYRIVYLVAPDRVEIRDVLHPARR